MYLYLSKVGHADINVAELLHWNLTFVLSQASYVLVPLGLLN